MLIIMFDIGSVYYLEPTDKFIINTPYKIPHAIYMGCYLDSVRKSHIFVHIVHDTNYINWVNCWTYIASNTTLFDKKYEENEQHVSMVDTHIYEYKFLDG